MKEKRDRQNMLNIYHGWGWSGPTWECEFTLGLPCNEQISVVPAQEVEELKEAGQLLCNYAILEGQEQEVTLCLYLKAAEHCIIFQIA